MPGSSIYTVNFPEIGEGVSEGEVVEWLKKVGESVKRDEPVVAVMTDKATVELPAPYPGIISRHYFKAGEIAIRDRPLYEITLDEGVQIEQNLSRLSSQSKNVHEAKALINPKGCSTDYSTNCSINSPPEIATEVLALPKVRSMAKEMGINLKELVGSGSRGQILVEDLISAKTISRSLEGDETEVLHGVRLAMSIKMGRAHIPQFSYFESIGVEPLIKLREEYSKKVVDKGISLGYMPFFIYGLSLLIRKYPMINSSIHQNKVVIHKQQNIGFAVASENGLVVPVLKRVQEMSLEEIIDAFEELKRKAIKGRLAVDEMGDRTITISNFGALGNGLWATPMVTEPEVAILAVGRIRAVPFVQEGALIIRNEAPLSWSFDHRVIDGQLAALLSSTYGEILVSML